MPGSGVVLGQSLDFVVQLRLDKGELLSPECVAAEVSVGERRLNDAAVRTTVEMAGADLARVRVSTAQAMDEPVIGIVLHSGCVSRVTRRFVVMADPPELRVSVPVMVPAMVPVASPVNALAPLASAVSVEAPLSSTRWNESSASRATPVPLAATRPVAARSVESGAQRAVARAARRAERRTAAATSAAAAPRAPRRNPLPAAAAVAAGPRLKLDPVEAAPVVDSASIVEQAIEAVALAASSARASAAAASATAERIAALERTVDSLRRDAQAQRDQAAALRSQLAAADDGGRWTWPLLLAVVALAALAVWLALRMRSMLRLREQDWLLAQQAQVEDAAAAEAAAQAAGARQPTSPIPFVTSELAPAPLVKPRSTPAWPPPAAAGLAPQSSPPPSPMPAIAPPLVPMPRPMPRPIPLAAPPAAVRPSPPPAPVEEFAYDTALQRTQPLPEPKLLDATAPRDVSIEELIDLEQQAEFFVVLGQDEAAVDLLVEHLRQSGGGSPLPYLKLLEIYRRRGDRDDYERTRTRFNHRFNAYAPDWDADLQAGRSLEDYPGIVPRLQQLWERPLDAMAELEALLFRKSSRGELFDLPAYREVLFLYALARDLLDREGSDAGNVDLLLPMADGGEFSSTSPAPFDEAAVSGFGHVDFDARPTAPVDFDLSSGADRSTSIFDTLDAVGAPPLRRG